METVDLDHVSLIPGLMGAFGFPEVQLLLFFVCFFLSISRSFGQLD